MNTEQKLALPSRRPDWRARLTAYMAEVAARSFRPGTHDCALFAAGAVEAVTGVDLAATWRGTYRSLAEGRAALGARGYADHIELAAAWCPEVAPSFAHIGDLAVLPGEDGDALGVIQGAHVYALRPSGLALVNRLHIKRAFSV